MSQIKWKNHFPVADGRMKFVGGDQGLGTSTLIRDHPIRREGQRDFLGESEGSPPSPPQVSYPDDYWNIDGSRDLSDSWTGFTQFTLLEEKPPEGYMWSRVRLTRRQLTSRPDHLWPELWTKLGRNAQLKEKHKWAIEKPRLDNARRLRRICFIDPEEMEFKETIKNARRKLETPMAPAMPCKSRKKIEYGETRTKTIDFKSKFACILEASESTRMRMEESPPNIMRTISQEKVTIH